MRFSLSAILFLLITFSALSAQTPQEEQVTLRLRFTITAENVEKTLYWFNDEEWEELHIEGLAITDPIDYIGQPVLNFYSEKPASVEAPLSTPIATVNVSAESSEWLILFIPKGKNKKEYRLLPLKDGDEAFPAQTVMLVNLTPNLIAGTFGQGSAQIASNDYAVVPFNEDNPQATSLRMRMAVREHHNGNWSLTHSTIIPSRGAHRRWLIVCKDDDPQTLIYPDFVKNK